MEDSATILEYNVSYNVIESSAYDKEERWKPVNIGKLKLTTAFNEFYQKKIGSRDLVYAIIDAYFDRDHDGSGKHWSSDGSTVSMLPSDNPNIELFDCYASSTWDWKDIYAVAKSSAKIIFDHDQKVIKVSGYKYNCSG